MKHCIFLFALHLTWAKTLEYLNNFNMMQFWVMYNLVMLHTSFQVQLLVTCKFLTSRAEVTFVFVQCSQRRQHAQIDDYNSDYSKDFPPSPFCQRCPSSQPCKDHWRSNVCRGVFMEKIQPISDLSLGYLLPRKAGRRRVICQMRLGRENGTRSGCGSCLGANLRAFLSE